MVPYLRATPLHYWIGGAGLVCLVFGVFGLVTQGGDLGRQNAAPGPLAYYPLEVGRYWVYQSHNQEAAATKRRIVGRQDRSAAELYFFDDGTIAQLEGEKVYEMGPDGGVNVIPLAVSDKPYTYTTQGLRIEKWVGSIGTQIEVNGRNYGDCLEVVTRFRRRDDLGGRGAAFASYYARGIGMVGRGPWPRRADEPLSVSLRDYGIEQL